MTIENNPVPPYQKIEPIVSKKAPLSEARKDFLLKLYDQAYNSINRYYQIVWQTVTVLVGFFGLLGLSEKKFISLNIACCLAVGICTWMMTHSIDAAFWMNRNMAMITNIEQQFMDEDDETFIHPFWTYQSTWNMADFFRIQFWFAAFILLLFITFHFHRDVLPSLRWSWHLSDLSLPRLAPYVLIMLAAYLLLKFYCSRRRKYADFICKSPGIKGSTSKQAKEDLINSRQTVLLRIQSFVSSKIDKFCE